MTETAGESMGAMAADMCAVLAGCPEPEPYPLAALPQACVPRLSRCSSTREWLSLHRCVSATGEGGAQR